MSGTPVNQMMSGSTKTVPVVGMGATVTYWSDRCPATVIAVRLFGSGPRKGQPREIDIQLDNWTVVSGNEGNGSAVYEYSRNTSAPVLTFRVNLRGRWLQKGLSGRGGGLALNIRQRHYDPHL